MVPNPAGVGGSKIKKTVALDNMMGILWIKHKISIYCCRLIKMYLVMYLNYIISVHRR